MSGRNSFSNSASRTALVGVLSAGSLAILWLACLSPSGRLGLGAVAGLFPVAAVLAAGRSAGFLCWGAVSILGLILMPDKSIALLYLLFFGLYPVLKSRFEGQRSFILGWIGKLLYFNLILAVVWLLFRTLFLSGLPAWLNRASLIWIVGNIVFIAYDIGLSRLIFGLFSRLPGRFRG